MGLPVAKVVRVLAERFGCSVRQARRYAGCAGGGAVVVVPTVTTVFTVKVPVVLVARVRDQARASGVTISAVVTAALMEFLARGQVGPERQ